ncbi:MAG: substrate-binding domain-containing protein [Nitrospirae bacterium]|nr:substrate-binding domain-containing protein [Nitrospirota bacterium]
MVITCFLLQSSVHAAEVLKIGGVGSAIGSMKLLAAAFEKLHQDSKIEVLSSLGSSGGIKAVSKGAIDIGIAGRPMTDEERNLGLSVIEYAKTPLIFTTGKDVKISGLSSEEIIKIYKGETLTWPDGKRIRIILRPISDSETMILKTLSPEIGKAVEGALSSGGMKVAVTAQEAADMLEKIPGTFGFSTLTLIISENRSLNILSFNGVTPGVKTLRDGSYPFLELYYMITKPEPSALVRKFTDFVHSPEGRKILEESGNLAVKGNPGS